MSHFAKPSEELVGIVLMHDPTGEIKSWPCFGVEHGEAWSRAPIGLVADMLPALLVAVEQAQTAGFVLNVRLSHGERFSA